MEIKRQKISTHETLRVRAVGGPQLLRGGELEGANRPAHLEGAELESTCVSAY